MFLTHQPHTSGRLIPYDGVPLEQDVGVAIPLTVTFSILSAAGIAFTISCLAFNFIFRKKKCVTRLHIVSVISSYMVPTQCYLCACKLYEWGRELGVYWSLFLYFIPCRLIRLSSPNLNYIIGAGAIILYIDVCFFIVPTTDRYAASILYNVRAQEILTLSTFSI